jgi:hypothetical protein
MHFVYASVIGVLLGAAIGVLFALIPLPAFVRTICAVTTTSVVAGTVTFVVFQRWLFPERFWGYWVFEPDAAPLVFPLIGGAVLHWATGWVTFLKSSKAYRVVVASCVAGALTALRLAWDLQAVLLPRF